MSGVDLYDFETIGKQPQANYSEIGPL